MGYQEIVEQDGVKRSLKVAVRMGRVSHAYLLSGEEGCGKRMMAKAFSMALLCEDQKDGEGCGKCPSCVMVKAGTHPDLMEVVREKAAYSVGEIRQQVVGNIGLTPMKGDRRVFLVPEAERMNVPAQNALLKTLEEPPPYTVIILLSERPGALLPTILSRTVTLPFAPVSDKAVEAYLMREHKIPDYLAHECAVFACGNVGKAIRYASDEGFRSLVEGTAKLLKDAQGLTIGEMMARLLDLLLPGSDDTKKRKLKDAGERELNRFLDLLLILNRDAMVWKAMGEQERLIFRDNLAYYKEAEKADWRALYENIGLISAARERLSANVTADLTMELMLMAWNGNNKGEVHR